MNETRISVSLTTIELQPAGAGTRLIFTEQGASLDGREDPAQREHGTRELLDALALPWSASVRPPDRPGSPYRRPSRRRPARASR